MRNLRNILKEAEGMIEDPTLEPVDFSGLEKELDKTLGVTGIKLTGGIEKGRRGENRIEFESQDLKDKAGILSSIYKSLTIQQFNSSLLKDPPNAYWLTVHFAYDYVSGGSNGTNILTAYYYADTKTWEFRHN